MARLSAFHLFLFILHTTTTTALPLLPRSLSKIQSDLTTLNADYIALRAADIANSNGGNPNDVQTAVNKVSKDTLLAITNAEASGPLSSSDSNTINSYISDTLEPSIKGAIQATIANKAQVAKAGLTSVVQTETRQLKLETDGFGTALQLKEPAGMARGQLKAAIAKIDADFDAAIAAFSS